MLVGKEKSLSKKPRRLFFRHIVRKIFLEDWAMKLVALLITFGLWFGVNLVNKGKQISQAFTAVPPSLWGLDNGAVTLAPVPGGEVAGRGGDGQVFNIRGCEFACYTAL